MRRKFFRFSALGTAAILSAAVILCGASSAWAGEDKAAETGAEVQEIIAEDAETSEDSGEFDESEAAPANVDEAVPAGENETEAAGADIMPVEMDELSFVTQYLQTNIDNDLTNVLIGMTDEEMDAYIGNAEGFSKTAPEAWKAVKAELGKRTSDEINVTVVQDGKIFTATQNVQFEKTDADFIYTFDNAMNPTDLVINVNYPMSVTLQRAGLNTLMGIGTVFFMLVFLCLVISMFKFIPTGSKKKAMPAAAPMPVKAPEPEPVYEEADDQELVAVIAAAIAAAEGTSPEGFIVRSIRRAGRRGRS